ncbi:hypothetical protein Lal_00028312 [Lupinus albus]|nr:hypothetical protein Lal_00028312 [Lupinus albus]
MCQQPKIAISRLGETTLAQARILQYNPGFHPPRELLYVKQLIMEYDQAFGQQINQTKCKFYTCKSLWELLTDSRLSENLWLGREHQYSSQNFTWEPRLGEMARLGERECVDTRRDPKVGGSGVDSNKPSNANTRQDPKVGGSGVDSNKPSNANTRQVLEASLEREILA